MAKPRGSRARVVEIGDGLIRFVGVSQAAALNLVADYSV